MTNLIYITKFLNAPKMQEEESLTLKKYKY